MRILLMAVILVLGGHIVIGAAGEIVGGRRTLRQSLGWLSFGAGLLVLALSGLWSLPLPTATGYVGVALVVAGLFLERRRKRRAGGDGEGDVAQSDRRGG